MIAWFTELPWWLHAILITIAVYVPALWFNYRFWTWLDPRRER